MHLSIEYNMMFGVSVMGFIVCGLDETQSTPHKSYGKFNQSLFLSVVSGLLRRSTPFIAVYIFSDEFFFWAVLFRIELRMPF